MAADDPRFSFRPFAEADLPILHVWLHRPHLQRWWRRGRLSLEEVRAKYLPRIAGADTARPFLACLGDEPVGYMQVYDPSAGDPTWWPDAPGPGVRGIDGFLADGDRLGRGLGAAMVRQFAAVIFADPSVTEIRLDPHPENLRAIRCYEKVGFRAVGPITTPDGPALWMRLDRAALNGRMGAPSRARA